MVDQGEFAALDQPAQHLVEDPHGISFTQLAPPINVASLDGPG
jgi:hypothetical protein